MQSLLGLHADFADTHCVRIAPSAHEYGALTALLRRLYGTTTATVRRCYGDRTESLQLAHQNATQTPSDDVYFEHAQSARSGVAFYLCDSIVSMQMARR